MKRTFSLIIAVVLSLNLLCTFAFCEETKTENGFTYVIADNNAEITKYSGNAENVAIPETLGGYTVTKIGDEAFCDNENLTSVTLPDTIKTIGEGAFFYCDALESINFPTLLETISDEAFAYCYSLSQIDLPESLKSIGKMAFLECESLNSVTIPKSVTNIGEGAFYGLYKLNEFIVDSENPTYSSLDGVLYNKDKTVLCYYPVGSKNTRFEVPDEVTKISDYAFYGANSLETLIMYEVEEIGDFAFYGCGNLSNIQMPLEIKKIGKEAFLGTDIKFISIPDSVISIGDHAFGFEYLSREDVYLPLATFTVYGKSGSIAQWIANKNGFRFNKTGESHIADCNIDGSVDVIDIALMRGNIIGNTAFTDEQRENADINSDNSVDIIDVVLVRNFIVNYL